MITAPMLLSEGGLELERAIESEDWVLEQKMDGARAIASLDPVTGWEWTTRNGSPLKFAAARQHFGKIEAELSKIALDEGIASVSFDGEIVVDTGVFHVFDMPWLLKTTEAGGLQVNQDVAYGMRREALELLIGDHEGQAVHRVPMMLTREEKARLWEDANERNVEGVVAKHIYGTYLPGERTKTQVKFKLVKTADVIVMSAERRFDHKDMVTHGSAKLGVVVEVDPRPWTHIKNGARRSAEDMKRVPLKKHHEWMLDPRQVVAVGNASLIGKDLSIEVGSVVEVAYLNFQDAMVQPRILRKRTDKRAEECSMEQFPTYSREVL